MTGESAARVPPLRHGSGITPQLVQRLTADRETLVIADSAIDAPRLSARSARALTVNASVMDIAVVRAIAREIARRPPQIVVAIGGGTVIDAGKVAALVLAPGRVFDYAIGHASVSALTLLPDVSPPVDVVAVPTTPGTSSETNSVAVLKNARGYRLLVGRALRPRHAVLDADNLASLTDAAVREGALEAFLRVAGASTSASRSATADREAITLGTALLDAATRDSASPAGRLRIARLSAATQRGAALRGRDPYSARHWYLANEVSFRLGVRKMVATVAIIAAVWRRIRSGDTRWGDRRSLERFWTAVADGAGLPLDPSAGIAALVDRWRIPLPPPPGARSLGLIAVATERSWGDRRPMLRGLIADDFSDVLRDSSWSPRPVGAIADLPCTDGRR